MNLVFVYGTLKQGYHNHRNLLLGSEFVGRAVTESRFDLIDCGFPVALVPDEGGGRRVRGELYWVNDKTLSRLDRLEGEGHMYSRVTVHTSHGTAMMYVGCEAFWEEQRNLLDACHVDGDGCYDWGACTPYPMLRLSRQLRVPYGVVLTIADWARRLVILDDQSDDTTSLRRAREDQAPVVRNVVWRLVLQGRLRLGARGLGRWEVLRIANRSVRAWSSNRGRHRGRTYGGGEAQTRMTRSTHEGEPPRKLRLWANIMDRMGFAETAIRLRSLASQREMSYDRRNDQPDAGEVQLPRRRGD